MSLKIMPVLCNAGSMDNYAYIITDSKTAVSAIVDAAEEKPIVNYCSAHNIKPKYIFTTHHHNDHTNANKALKEKYNLTVVGSAVEQKITPAIDVILKDGDIFQLGEIKAQIILAPGHTKGHILWYFPQDTALFTGDVLFNMTIGGIFEGTAQQMWQSIEKIKSLPDDVAFYPGHEYTAMSLPGLMKQSTPEAQQYLQLLSQKQQNNAALVGIPLGLEKQCNPYLRAKNEEEFMNICVGQ